jgi:2',3'-cyclic-nucleotide 2'-phosphodiesterase (5'-nucleotidase family)
MQKKYFLLTLCTSILLLSCKVAYQPNAVEYNDYKISKKEKSENALSALIKPYADSVNKKMSDVIATAGMNLEKNSPEGTLGNVLADAMLNMAQEKFALKVDAAILNSGGIRLPSLSAGEITRGKIFEIAPFDNLVVLLKIDAKNLHLFLDQVADKGGWPCSGMSFQIKNKKAVDIKIAGHPIDPSSVYTIATVDYIANGGDNCDMLKNIHQQNIGYLFRDAVIEYFSKMQKEGKVISSNIEKRVSNAE